MLGVEPSEFCIFKNLLRNSQVREPSIWSIISDEENDHQGGEMTYPNYQQIKIQTLDPQANLAYTKNVTLSHEIEKTVRLWSLSQEIEGILSDTTLKLGSNTKELENLRPALKTLLIQRGKEDGGHPIK